MLNLMQALYEREFTAEDIATFIALQWVLDRARIRVTDLDPALDDVEVQWANGDRHWFNFEGACEAISDEIAHLRKEGTS